MGRANFRRRIDQAAAHQWFHHNDAQALAGGELQAAGSRLVVDIDVVVLDLAEAPQVGPFHYFFEGLIVVVEREAKMANPPVGKCAFCLIEQFVPQHDIGPRRPVERVQQVEVDVVGLELGQLLVEEAVKVGRRLHQPDRELGGQLHLVAVTVLQRSAHHQLALAFVVGVRGVNVIDAAIDGKAQHANRFGFIDIWTSALPIVGWESHAPEAQGGTFPIELSKRTILHEAPLLMDCVTNYTPGIVPGRSTS